MTIGDLVARVKELEELAIRSARKSVEGFVRPTLEGLLMRQTFSGFDNGQWQGSVASAGFLPQFFWARDEPDFVYWRDSFENAIRAECKAAVGSCANWDPLTFDLIMVAGGIESDKDSVARSEAWAIKNLYEEVLDLLMNCEMDTVADWGVEIPERDDNSLEP